MVKLVFGVTPANHITGGTRYSRPFNNRFDGSSHVILRLYHHNRMLHRSWSLTKSDAKDPEVTPREFTVPGHMNVRYPDVTRRDSFLKLNIIVRDIPPVGDLACNFFQFSPSDLTSNVY